MNPYGQPDPYGGGGGYPPQQQYPPQYPPQYYPQGYPPQQQYPPGYGGYYQQPPPKKSHKKLIIAVVAVVAIVVVLVIVLFVIQFTNGGGSGTVALQSDGSGEGIGWTPLNISSAGTVAVSWHMSGASAVGGVVVVSGSCTTATTCDTALQTGYVCVSPPGSSNGANSGTCTFTGSSGTHTVIGVETSAYSNGDTIPFTYTISAPLV